MLESSPFIGCHGRTPTHSNDIPALSSALQSSFEEPSWCLSTPPIPFLIPNCSPNVQDPQPGQRAKLSLLTTGIAIEGMRTSVHVNESALVLHTPSDNDEEPESPLSPISARIASESGEDECDTPLTSPNSSPVKLSAAPCDSLFLQNTTLQLDGQQSSSESLAEDREALLGHCERHVTSRQRYLTAGGVRSPDRFIPARANTPTKESLIMTKPAAKLTTSEKHSRIYGVHVDPFGPAPRRSSRMAEQYATLRVPALPPRPYTRTGTSVTYNRHAEQRTSSAGAIWSVGGTVVTEGVASTPNGRGGRVTSGTSAAHYTADFLRRRSPSEEETRHSQRLAVAMDVDQSARMIDHSSPSSPVFPLSPVKSTSRSRVWRDGAWEKEDPSSPMTRKLEKTKDIPIIPFRVLDAPALRDDYYCSLLAYSPTMQCLAVGLGPHVYLWSESRGTDLMNIPDSLAAPFGAHVTSLSFSSAEAGSAILAIGRADGRITLWSPLDHDPRFDSEQPAPVSCVCFRPNTVRRQSRRDSSSTVATEELLVGDEAGHVYCYIIEWPNQEQRDLFDWHGSMTLLARISCHSQQICGIAWSPDGEYFATGGNDNQLLLFEAKKLLSSKASRPRDQRVQVRVRERGSSLGNATVSGQDQVRNILLGQQKHIFNLNAAVKAIAFAPWQPSLLAVGGGSNDRCIHFFHTLSGANLATIDCHSQITSLVWSERRKEIAATFGFAQPEHPFRIAVFTWPGCKMVVRIPWWSEERALYAVSYPRGPTTGDINRTRGSRSSRVDAEGRPWYRRRTRQEGCLVVATSDASIKFHEIWAESNVGTVASGILGSQILEGEFSEGDPIR